MNTTLDSVRIADLDARLPRAVIGPSLDRHLHVTWAEKIELRLGLWLLLHSARRHESTHDHARRVANARALIDREHRALRSHALDAIRT